MGRYALRRVLRLKLIGVERQLRGGHHGTGEYPRCLELMVLRYVTHLSEALSRRIGESPFADRLRAA